MENTESKLIAKLILNTKEPCVFRNANVPWSCFSMSLEEWCETFDKEINGAKVNFDKCDIVLTSGPQWERYRKKEMMTLNDFTKFCKSRESQEKKETTWYSYSYKNIEEAPLSCRKGVEFGFLGFPDIKDASFWLSSPGAHTPCHYDSYGCNIVVQVFGRKLWLLFPPDAELTPVRVPYEESSVYCSESFFHLNKTEQLEHVSGMCYKCVLNPGDLLIVPNKWWHYVESLTASLSINTWIPLNLDKEARLEECIVRYVVKKITSNSSDEDIKFFLNPNEVGELESEKYLLSLLLLLVNDLEGNKTVSNNYQNLSELELQSLMLSVKVDVVKRLTRDEFINVIKQKIVKHTSTDHENINQNISVKAALINSICSPQCMDTIKSLFLENLKKTQNIPN